MDEMYFGVYDQLLYARKTEPVQGTNLPFTSSSYPSTAACILLRKHTYAIYHSLAHWPVLTNRNHIHLECCILFPTLSWYTRQTFVRQNCILATYVLYPVTYMCLTCNRSSVDGNSDNNRSWDAESKSGRCCGLCTKAPKQESNATSFFLSAMHKHYHVDSNNFFYPFCSDPNDRLAPRPVLARYCETDGFQNFSLWLVYNTPWLDIYLQFQTFCNYFELKLLLLVHSWINHANHHVPCFLEWK